MASSARLQDRVDDNSTASFEEQHVNRVNPHWVRLLKFLQMNVRYERCSGAELVTTDGKTILDCLSGYCVHNLGHNHLAVIAAIKEELDRIGPAMLQSHVPERAGELATRLCQLADGATLMIDPRYGNDSPENGPESRKGYVGCRWSG